MTGSTNRITVRDQDSGRAFERVEFFEDMSAIGYTSPYVRLQGSVVVQLSGDATSVAGRVEYSSRDPGGAEANWAPAEDTGFSGDLSAGIAPRTYVDPASGWWRFNLTGLTGGNCKVSIIGESA